MKNLYEISTMPICANKNTIEETGLVAITHVIAVVATNTENALKLGAGFFEKEEKEVNCKLIKENYELL